MTLKDKAAQTKFADETPVSELLHDLASLKPGQVPVRIEPASEALASGAMVQTAQALDQVERLLDQVEEMTSAIRAAVRAKRAEADKLNSEFIELCANGNKRVEAVRQVLGTLGAKVIDS